MEYILYISRFLYRIRWWLLGGTAIITLLVILMTRNMGKSYTVEATLYTGIVSGYSIDNASGNMDYAATQNAMDNLINIIRSESTLQRVSLRLFARTMMNGDMEKDNDIITAYHFQQQYNHVKNSPQGKQILALIDKSSEDKTVENLRSFMRPNKDNYIYGLFYYTHPHYSFTSLKNIRVLRKGSSDLLDISYSADDPGIAYNTLDILLDEFVNEYRAIRYGETDKVIAYFKSELQRVGGQLRIEEDSLTNYNIEKRIINYYDETKEIAAINKEYELREQDALISYNSAKVMLEELEKQMDINTRQLSNNLQFVNKLKEVSALTGKISEIETMTASSNDGESLKQYKDQLSNARKDLSTISDRYMKGKQSKEGIAKTTIVEQWLDLILQFEKAKSDLQIIQKSRQDMNERYVFYAPVGSTIKRKERTIDFTERNYLSILDSYNTALMRKKNLEMTSATLKVLNSPAFPISPNPTGRRKIIMAACAGSFLFILGFMALIEITDRTLRDSIRTQRFTGCKVLGAFPIASTLRYRRYNKECNNIATKYLSSSIFRFFTNRKGNMPYIVNFLSTDVQDGKTYLIDQLKDYWEQLGLKVCYLNWKGDFDVASSQFLLAQSINELYKSINDDILIVEYPSLKDTNIPSTLLKEADLNLIVARADRGWKATDKLLLSKIKNQVGESPLYIYLNRAKRDVVQDYTGMLPPYTYIRTQLYRFSQLALTENVKMAKKKDIEENDDE